MSVCLSGLLFLFCFRALVAFSSKCLFATVAACASVSEGGATANSSFDEDSFFCVLLQLKMGVH